MLINKTSATQTATTSITNTKLAMATAAMLMAAGLAFAAAPLSKSMSYVNDQGQKCGVNSYSVTNSCKAGYYRQMKVTCFDGSTFTKGDPTSCKSSATWASYAESLCKGRCVVPSVPPCVDSDGTNVTTQGAITMSTGNTYKDSCPSNDPTKVWEGICRADGSYIFNALNCPAGATCQNGACVASTTPGIIYQHECSDSDGGKDYYTRSNLSTDTGWTGQENCAPNNINVLESYCESAQLLTESYACPNGCLNGACVEQQSRLTISNSTPSQYQYLINGENLAMRLNFTNAGNRLIYITNITFRYDNRLSTSSTVQKWTLYRSGNGDPYIISPNGNVNAQNSEVTFSISPPLTIPMGETRSMDVMATIYGISSDDSGGFSISLESADDIVTTGDVSQNSFPFRQSLHLGY